MPALIAFPVAIGLWILAAVFFNNPACGAVDALWHPGFVKIVEKAQLPLLRLAAKGQPPYSANDFA